MEREIIMKNELTFEEQTEQIVRALLSKVISKQWEISFRGLPVESEQESDAASSSSASTFDPITIASQLQEIGDEYNENFQRRGQRLVEEVKKGKVEKFRETVESLSKNWSSQSPGLEYERAFLAVAVKLFEYLAQKASDVAQAELLTGAISGNAQVRGYIERQGGWENLGNRRRQHSP